MNLKQFFTHFLRAYTYELILLDKPPNKKPIEKIDTSLIPKVSKHVEKFIEKKQPKTIAPPEQPTPLEKPKTFAKIMPLLNDPTITDIECSGPNQPLSITRFNRREIIRTKLTKQEINDFLNWVSQQTHIPLLEGIFRANMANFHIDAVISDAIGSRFVIEKLPQNGPYYY